MKPPYKITTPPEIMVKEQIDSILDAIHRTTERPFPLTSVERNANIVKIEYLMKELWRVRGYEEDE